MIQAVADEFFQKIPGDMARQFLVCPIGQEEYVRNGVAAVVHKPFELKPLLEVVSRVLEEARHAAAAPASAD